MESMFEGYPFTFVMNDKDDTDDLLLYTMQYRFKSSKSHHTYIVRVEKYPQHVYCLKFFDKANINSKEKYSLKTNTFEPRKILYTMYHIFLEVLKKDNKASLFFIGAEDDRDELGETTRRYRLYRKFVSSIISNKMFEHFRINELSLYILINKNSDIKPDILVNKIVEEVTKAYNA